MAGYPSGIVQIWDPAAGAEISRVDTPPGYHGTLDYVALTADWKTAFVARDGRTVSRKEVGGEKRTTIEYAGEVLVFDTATRKSRPSIALPPGRGALEAVVSPDGTRLITSEAGSYDVKTRSPIPFASVYRDLSVVSPPVELATGFGMAVFSPDGKTFVLATSNGQEGPGRLQIFGAFTGKQKALLAEAPKASIYFPAYSPDGKRVVAEVRELGEAASVAKVWDAVSGKELAVLAPAERSIVLYPAFSSDGRFVTAITNKGAGQIWDAATGTIVLTHRFGEKGYTREFVVVSPDGRLAAAVGRVGVTFVGRFRKRLGFWS